jgi:hypothetical protein
MMNFEEEAEATIALHKAHASLEEELKLLTSDEGTMRIPVAVKRLVDNGIEPIIVAKTMLIGRRQGNLMYSLAAASIAISAAEQVSETVFGIAIKPLPREEAATQLAIGASWLAQQFNVDVTILKSLVMSIDAQVVGGQCAVDLAVSVSGARELIMEALQFGILPEHAPLEMQRPTQSDGLQTG